MPKKIILALLLVFLGACAKGKTEEAKVFFIEPADGATVESPFKIKMGVSGMEVKPAGETVEGTGHHHLIINGGALQAGKIVPSDEKHLHYGKGQTEAELELEPGEYDLTLQFADGVHASYGKPLSSTIHITVAGSEEATNSKE